MINYNLTEIKEQIKKIALEILEAEKERTYLADDMKELKLEIQMYAPKKLVGKILKVYFRKGFSDRDMEEYTEVCDRLGMPFGFEQYLPSSNIYDETEEGKECRAKLLAVLGRYDMLAMQKKELSDQIKELYARAKNKGISVPLLKKLVDFVLHPDKLRAYHEDTPLLEAYTEVIPEIE